MANSTLAATPTTLLELRGLTVRYGGITALRGIDLEPGLA